MLWFVLVAYMLLSRTPMEDKALRGVFREQWDEWAKTTPYRVIPFVF